MLTITAETIFKVAEVMGDITSVRSGSINWIDLTKRSTRNESSTSLCKKLTS